MNPSSQTPCVRTAEGQVITESLRIIEKLDAVFPDSGYQLFPTDPAQREEAVKLMNSFSSVFPSGTRPSSRGSFLYTWNRALPRTAFEATLDKVEALLAERGGPFFFGGAISGVDCAFAPFLERWSHQVPALVGLETRDPSRWPLLARWYDALEEEVAAYCHRVQGDRHTWRMALAGAGGGDTSLADDDDEALPAWMEGEHACDSARAQTLAARVPAVGPAGHGGAEEAARRLIGNRGAVVEDAARRALGVRVKGATGVVPGSVSQALEDGVVDRSLRAVAQFLLDRTEGGGEGEGEGSGAADVRGFVESVVAGVEGGLDDEVRVRSEVSWERKPDS